MALLGLLIGIPALASLVLLVMRDDRKRGIFVKIAAAATAATAIATAITFFGSASTSFRIGSEVFTKTILVLEVVLCAVILWLTFSAKRILIGLLSIVQTALIVWFELTA
ncbi:MAG: hypothetical protein PHU79_05300, partial [Oscillospiraceae bacterium]|nr:hypothetical protein [Oscillospiraceae bacterium]